MTTSERASLKRLARRVRIECAYGARLDWNKQDKWQQEANGWHCTLKYQGRRYSFDFWQGSAITGEPDVLGVLDCLLSDSGTADNAFEDWCAELGYDTDSRKAEATYRACQKVRENMQRLLGSDFEAFLYAERD